MTGRRLALSLALLGAPLGAQADAVLAPLRQGELKTALDALDQGARVSGAEARIECARRIAELAPPQEAAIGAALRTRALTHALHLVRTDVPAALRSEQHTLAARIGQDVAALLKAQNAEPDSEAFRTRVLALETCREALRAQGDGDGRAALDAALELIPLCRAAGRYAEAARLCREALDAGDGQLSDAQRADVRGSLGMALLEGKRAADAVPFLGDYVARAPHDPAHVLPVARMLPRSFAGEILGYLRPVLERAPAPASQQAWRDCLDLLYRCLAEKVDALAAARAFVDERTVIKPLPSLWGGATWGEGYRVWRPDNQEPGRQYSGRRALEAMLPVSAGWREVAAPPRELARWGNHAICFTRAPDGPTLVIYWFAPDLDYWYGTTPRNAGVTEKTVRGFNRGGIADLVADVAYGIDTEKAKLGSALRRGTPLPFTLRVQSPIRKQWRVGDVIYDETFFSMGQVTGEMLLRITERDLELLEPEIRWLYASVRGE